MNAPVDRINDAARGHHHIPAWGPWVLDRHRRELVIDDSTAGYEIDLDSCVCSAEVLDWICQIANKGWADDKCLAGLVRALNDILEPQDNLCSGGGNKVITSARLRSLVKRRDITWCE